MGNERWQLLPVFGFDLAEPWLVDEPLTDRGPDWFEATINNAAVLSARIEWRHGYVNAPVMDEQLRRARDPFDVDEQTLEVHELTDELGFGPDVQGWESGTQFFTAGGQVVVAQTVLNMQVGGTVEIVVSLVAGFDDFDALTDDYFAMISSIELVEGMVPPVNEILIASGEIDAAEAES